MIYNIILENLKHDSYLIPILAWHRLLSLKFPWKLWELISDYSYTYLTFEPGIPFQMISSITGECSPRLCSGNCTGQICIYRRASNLMMTSSDAPRITDLAGYLDSTEPCTDGRCEGYCVSTYCETRSYYNIDPDKIRSSRRPVSVGRSTRKPVLVPPLMHGFSSSYQTDSLSLSSPVERSHMTKQEAAEKELEIKNFFLASEKLRYFDKMVF